MRYQYQNLLDDFTAMCAEILDGALTGVYLHGSMAMGCFNPKKSDIDLIVVVEENISIAQKLAFMQKLVRLNENAPEKGIEVSIVRREHCMPFVYPTPFELHFSNAHLDRFKDSPDEYVRNMKGEDRDLAAHFTVINRYGAVLFGEKIPDVFGKVPKEAYADSICLDVENAAEEISESPVYIILNLCRVLAFLREGLCLSKAQGGEWGIGSLPEKYRGAVRQALDCYLSDTEIDLGHEAAREFAEYMLSKIKAHSYGVCRPEYLSY